MSVILTYHRVAHPKPGERESLFVSPANFREQIQWLRSEGFEFLSLDQLREDLLEGRRRTHGVCITFDDGSQDLYTNAFPLLREHTLPATVFLIAQRVQDDHPSFLTQQQLGELKDSSLRFGSHGVTHSRLARLPEEHQRHEVSQSRVVLQQLTGQPINWFCYPYGNFSPLTRRLVEEAGYLGAVSTIRDNRSKPEQLFALPRVMVMPSTTLRRFHHYFSWLYHLEHWWKNRRRWHKS